MKFIQDRIATIKELPPKTKLLVYVLIVAIVFLFFKGIYEQVSKNSDEANVAATVKNAKVTSTPATANQRGINSPNGLDYKAGLADPSRNQGLEDLKVELSEVKAQLKNLKGMAQSNTGHGTADVPPEPRDKEAPPKAPLSGGESADPPGVNWDDKGAASSKTSVEAPIVLKPKAEVYDFRNKPKKDGDENVITVTIPTNSALEGTLLTGIAAASPGGTTGASGSMSQGMSVQAKNVGTPFISKIMGSAILPNGWRWSDLGQCFMGGTGIANLNRERVRVISDVMSCINEKGEIYEGEVVAYGLDVDGTEGLSGKVVSKQGSILLQAALIGGISGIGQALAPTALPSYNSNATSGSQQGYQFPNPSVMAASGVSQGFASASQQLTKFYLQYASQTLPIIEVNNGSRVTWILKKPITLKRSTVVALNSGSK